MTPLSNDLDPAAADLAKQQLEEEARRQAPNSESIVDPEDVADVAEIVIDAACSMDVVDTVATGASTVMDAGAGLLGHGAAVADVAEVATGALGTAASAAGAVAEAMPVEALGAALEAAGSMAEGAGTLAGEAGGAIMEGLGGIFDIFG
ncbi:MAG: hypothetical protein ACAI35_10845 [Candidatus Methylacidiphilales bacterium]|nr:hypothetical protein [Candidatus Methylacidiphilales bacterium]